MKAEHGFRDEQVKPYTYNSQPFLVDKRSAMQGYVTSEPYSIEKAAGFAPKVFLLADAGFDPYATTIETRRDTLANKPSTVQRFVEASILGWYAYLYGDASSANQLIMKQNPDMTADRIAYATSRMRDFGIADSGDTLSLGIGAMTEARVKGFFDMMVRVGIAKPATDWRQAFDARFVNKGLGRELRRA